MAQELALALETRARWQVPNEPRAERPGVALEASVRLFKGLFPDAVPRSVTATYNCMGLVVASRRTWVDPEHLLTILRQDGYRPLAGAAEAEVGDVVVYRDEGGDVCHAGLVVRKNLLTPGDRRDPLTVLSKWGADAEYVHDMSRVPELLGAPVEFWTDRRGV